MCADSHNGYVCEFSSYTGKEGNQVEVGIGESVVLKHCDRITGKHFHIYCDNYFTSVSVQETAGERTIHLCDTPSQPQVLAEAYLVYLRF